MIPFVFEISRAPCFVVKGPIPLQGHSLSLYPARSIRFSVERRIFSALFQTPFYKIKRTWTVDLIYQDAS